MRCKAFCITLVAIVFTACASQPPETPFPAFVQVSDLEDVFLASLPGVRAKPLAGDPQTRRSSKRIDLPPAWQGTSGGEPGRSMEIFVLEGVLSLADIELGPGGYAFLPAGSLGFNMYTGDGAQILYFVNDVDPGSIIRSPIIIDSSLLDWQGGEMPGVSIRELRRDPGTGSRTWLMRVEVGAVLPWESSSAVREGYLVDGDFRQSECVLGKALTGEYSAGGYFYRPGGAVYGGPESGAVTEATWLLRESTGGEISYHDACPSQSP